jgi:hypothetical protein
MYENKVEILHTHVWKCMKPVETIPRMEGWIHLWYAVRTLVNVTRYPKYNPKFNNNLKKVCKKCFKNIYKISSHVKNNLGKDSYIYKCIYIHTYYIYDWD